MYVCTRYTHKGSLAYVGSDKAVMDIPRVGPVTGYTAGKLTTFTTHGFSLCDIDSVTECACGSQHCKYANPVARPPFHFLEGALQTCRVSVPMPTSFICDPSK